MRWINSTLFANAAIAVCSADVSAATCESLRSFSIKQGTITSVDVVAAGPFVQPGRAGAPARGGAAAPGAPQGPAPQARAGGPPPAPVMLPEHCRVKMMLKPSADSNINAELWLPTTTWNG